MNQLVKIHFAEKTNKQKKRETDLLHIVSVLVDFYCDRLSDKTCVQNLLNGLVALTAYDHFTSTNAVSVIKR